MRSLSGLLPASGFRKSSLLSLVIFAGALYAAYEAAGFIIAGDTTGLIYVGLLFAVFAFIISMLNNWRRGPYIFLIWLLFEDFARKYLGNNMMVYFSKDILVLIVYLSVFLAWRRKELEGFRPPFLVPVVVMIAFGFIQVFNPASPHLIYGAMGMKLFFYYVPLVFVGYALLDSEKELLRFFLLTLVPVVFVASLGIIQSVLGPTFLNPAVMQEDIRELGNLYRVAPISGVIVYRPTSVFVSAGRYCDLLYVAWPLALGFLGYTLLRFRKGRWFAFLAVAFIAAAMVLTGSRGSFAFAIIDVVVITCAFFWGSVRRTQDAVRILRAVTRIGISVALAMTLILAFYPDALLDRLAVYSETLSPDSSQSELYYRAHDYPLKAFTYAFLDDRWPYGYGIGTASLGTQYVGRIFGAKPLGVGVENGFGSIVVEMGIGGLILWLIMSGAILLSAWRATSKLRGTPWFPVGFTIFFYVGFLLVPEMTGGLAYQDFILNSYFWFLLGALFRLGHIKATAEKQSAETALATQRPRWAT